MAHFNVTCFNMRGEYDYKTPDKVNKNIDRIWRSIDAAGKYLVIGDVKGLILVMQLELENQQDDIFRVLTQKTVSKKEIEMVKISLQNNLLFYLTNGSLEVRTFPDLGQLNEKNKNMIIMKNCHIFAMEGERKKDGEDVNGESICCVNTSGKMIIYDYVSEEKWFKEGKGYNINLTGETVKHLAFDSKFIIVSLKTMYYIFNKKTGGSHKQVDNKNASNPIILKLKNAWLGMCMDLGVIYDFSGRAANHSQFPFGSTSTKEIKGILHNGNYIVILKESVISVYNFSNSIHMQDCPLPTDVTAKAFASLGNNLFVLANKRIKNEEFSQVLHYVRVPYGMQIDTLLKTGKVDEARDILNQTITKGEFEKSDQFYMRSSWILFKSMNIPKAIEHFKFIKYNPLDIALLCPFVILPFFPPKKAFTFDKLVAENYSKKSEIEAKTEEVINAIIILLQEAKTNMELTNNVDIDSNKKIEFKIVNESPNKDIIPVEPWTLEMHLTYINTWILQIFIEYNKDRRQISDFFNRLKHKLLLDFDKFQYWTAEKVISTKTKVINYVRALVYEKTERYEDALNIWKEELTILANKNITGKDFNDYTKEICSHITLTLCAAKKRVLIEKFAEIVLERDPDQGLKIFTSDNAQKYDMPEDDIVAYLEVVEKKYPSSTNLSELYLCDLVKKNLVERYHTNLATIFIQKITTLQLLNKNEKEIIEYHKKLQDFLRNSKIYNPTKILEKLKNTDLIEEKIIVYSKQKMHEEALNSLIDLCQKSNKENSISFLKAETYCLQQPECILSVLLEKLIAMHLQLKKTNKQDSKQYKDYIIKFLQMYSNNYKLDIDHTLKIIPENWKIEKLTPFLISIFVNRISKESNVLFGSGVAEVEFLNKEFDLMKKKKAYVQVSTEKTCKVCKRKLEGMHLRRNQIIRCLS